MGKGIKLSIIVVLVVVMVILATTLMGGLNMLSNTINKCISCVSDIKGTTLPSTVNGVGGVGEG